MKLWKELLVSGLENDNYELDYINDEIIKDIIQNKCYKILLQIKQTIENQKLSDKGCFDKIEEIICSLEENNIFCSRHDF